MTAVHAFSEWSDLYFRTRGGDTVYRWYERASSLQATEWPWSTDSFSR